MRFLIDTQLPPALKQLIVGMGHEAEHVLDLGMGQSKDRLIWEHAAAIGAVIITKDEDFAVLQGQSEGGPAVLWVRCGNMRRKALLERFAQAMPGAVTALEAGAPLVELK